MPILSLRTATTRYHI